MSLPCIYALVIFPKALRHVDEAVTDLFDRLNKWVTPVPTILAETFRSLNACRRTGEGRFIGCAQLLLVWFHSHFWKVDKVPYRVFFESYSPLKEATVTTRRDDILEQRWIEILQNLRKEDVEWKAPWMVPNEVLYQCGNFDWVPLPRIWGAVGYAPLLVLRQYKARQFISATYGLDQSEFSYNGDNYKKEIRDISETWKQARCMKILTGEPMTTPEYDWLRSQRINDNIPTSGQKNTRSLEEHLRLEAEKLRKGKNKAEEDLDSLKIDYKKLRRSLVESQNEKEQLKTRVSELEIPLYQYRSRNSIVELKDSLSKIEEMKRRIEELESALHSCELRTELFETREGRSKEELHHFHDQVRNRDYLMGEAIVQIREVADHLQTLAAQADILSMKYELQSDRNQELASFTRAKTKKMDQRLEQFQKDMQDQMQDQLAKLQQEMKDQMLEAQRNMMAQIAQMLNGAMGKGKSPMAITGEDSECIPPGFTPPHVQHEEYPQRSSITIRPQQG
ncbi:coiled-coil domain-containing protein 102A-like protein [Gossypium australe]|uniref:Coiled-coil domain-containing protein 102A-like protein n=1 Tax=Gossypium australe TaxID=47621 RepID=A0A5B6V8N2_9ROSI|nr:coiled-coil domain-containing protein 102A-like protein [Gossypium australe]